MQTQTLKAADFKVGDKFVIKTKMYYGLVFTVKNVYGDSLTATDNKGAYDVNCFSDTNFSIYGDKVRITERAPEPTKQDTDLQPNDIVKYKHIEGNQKNVYLVGEVSGKFMFIRKVRKDGQDIKNHGQIWIQALVSNFVKIGERVATEVVTETLTATQTLGLALTHGEKAFTKEVSTLHGEHNQEFRARAKAEDELKLNQSIRFENGVLRFTSSKSGENYIVTKDGCSLNCPADKGIHYHSFLYELCAASEVFTPFTRNQSVSQRRAA